MSASGFYDIAVTNLLHGLASLLWLLGLKRWVRPLPPALYAGMLQLALALPPLFAILRLLRVPMASTPLPLVRAGFWADAIRGMGLVPNAIFFLLLGGVVVIFVIQEAVPLVSMLRKRVSHGDSPDPHLMTVLENVHQAYQRAGMDVPRVRRLGLAFRIRSRAPIAALHGLKSPALVVSDSLLRLLEPAELEAVVAHEVAHRYYGDNLRTLLIWVARAFQAFNPISLVLFRDLIEAREEACDALAAHAVSAPRTLAAALMKFRDPSPDRPRGAREQLRERADSDSMNARYQALMEMQATRPPFPAAMCALYGLMLGGLLWAIA